MPTVRHQGRALTDAFITEHHQHIQKLITNNVQNNDDKSDPFMRCLNGVMDLKFPRSINRQLTTRWTRCE